VPIFALLTRLLLCLSLVLNGAGVAVATPGMSAAPHAAAEADVPRHAAAPAHDARSADAAMPCHTQDAATAPAADPDAVHHHAHSGKPGCCGSAAGCQCPHAQPLPALVALPMTLPIAAQRLFPHGRADGRGAPGLPRLERPPSA
jgi:hypothetical protein